MDEFRFFPRQASQMAGQVDLLVYVMLTVTLLVVFGVFTVIFVFCVRYRRGSVVERHGYSSGNVWMEIAWSVAPLAIFLVFFAWGAVLYYHERMPPPGSLDIYVVGKQWMWKVQHVEGRREINELHVPLGRPVRLVMTAQDVIHSFFVPEFRVHQDVLPDRFTTIWFVADRIGAYHTFCSQFCGTAHSQMVGTVFVMQPAEYEKWLNEPLPVLPAISSGAYSVKAPGAIGGALTSMAARGEEVYRRAGCIQCHGNPAVAPSLEGVYGSSVPLEGGGSVTADENYLQESILYPQAKIVRGYTPVMPSFQRQLGPGEMGEIVEFIKSLGKKGNLQPR